MREVKHLPFEMKLNTAKRTIQGYASTYDRDQVGDIVVPGAFKKTISERANKVKFLWQHDAMQPIGKPLVMEEDSKGLYVEALISKTSLGNDALALAEDGVIDAFSIGYDVIKDAYDQKQDARMLKELKLYEFSLVSFPANEAATISNIKSMSKFHELLRNTSDYDVRSFLKEGRKLNSANVSLIQEAISALQAVLAIEPDDEDEEEEVEKSRKSTHKNSLEPLAGHLKGITPDDLKEIIQNLKVR